MFIVLFIAFSDTYSDSDGSQMHGMVNMEVNKQNIFDRNIEDSNLSDSSSSMTSQTNAIINAYQQSFDEDDENSSSKTSKSFISDVSDSLKR